jgi:FkbM family methyltransferase
VISLLSLARKTGLAGRLNSSPFFYFLLRDTVSRWDSLLPLEPDFWGFRELPPREGIFLDIGANDGISARSFRKVRPGTPILSIEPNPRLEPSLKALKSSLPDFDYRILALGDAPGEAVLYTPVYRGRALSSYSSLDPGEIRARMAMHLLKHSSWEGVRLSESRVPVDTVDSLGLFPAWVKIDVEGREAAVLRGMAATLRRSRPAVLVEFIPAQWPAILDFIRSLDYVPRVFDAGRRAFREPAGPDPDNIFLLPGETACSNSV